MTSWSADALVWPYSSESFTHPPNCPERKSRIWRSFLMDHVPNEATEQDRNHEPTGKDDKKFEHPTFPLENFLRRYELMMFNLNAELIG
jgi:hypothetical protein